jgi:hypothetical protein
LLCVVRLFTAGVMSDNYHSCSRLVDTCRNVLYRLVSCVATCRFLFASGLFRVKVELAARGGQKSRSRGADGRPRLRSLDAFCVQVQARRIVCCSQKAPSARAHRPAAGINLSPRATELQDAHRREWMACARRILTLTRRARVKESFV